VLEVTRYPEIRFESTSVSRETRQVVGRLTLHGVTREVRFSWKEEGGARVAEVRLDQREWDIRPYRAFMGALKLQPEVRVRVRLVP
jgi:polyisoprenoid-binding protein YceI